MCISGEGEVENGLPVVALCEGRADGFGVALEEVKGVGGGGVALGFGLVRRGVVRVVFDESGFSEVGAYGPDGHVVEWVFRVAGFEVFVLDYGLHGGYFAVVEIGGRLVGSSTRSAFAVEFGVADKLTQFRAYHYEKSIAATSLDWWWFFHFWSEVGVVHVEW